MNTQKDKTGTQNKEKEFADICFEFLNTLVLHLKCRFQLLCRSFLAQHDHIQQQELQQNYSLDA